MPDNLSDMMTDKERAFDTCLKLVGRIECTKVRIYNIIRDVGYGKLSADRALHQLVEDYHQLGVTAQAMSELADRIHELPEADTAAETAKPTTSAGPYLAGDGENSENDGDEDE